MSWNKGNTFLIVTGASRGLGRAFAQELSSTFQPNSTVYLTARSTDALAETAASLKSSLTVKTFNADHSKADIGRYREIISTANAEDFDSAIIIHNAGSVGKQGVNFRDYDSKQEIDDYLALNYTSPSLLNSVFLKHFDKVKNITVINISSICGVIPFKSWANYCAIKSARDMLFKVLAAEEGKRLRILNYSPGPVDTQLVQTFLSDPKVDASITSGFDGLRKEKKILQPTESAAKLVDILTEDKFENAEHVDYYGR